MVRALVLDACTALGTLAAAMILWLPVASAAVDPSPRVALAVGNGNYDPANISRLDNPVHDARLVANALEQVGFNVALVTDVDPDEFEHKIEAFGNRLRVIGADAVGLFYYTGHGMEADGQNYLIPLAARIQSPLHFGRRAVPAQSVLDRMEHAGYRLNIMILDACRDNPFGNKRGQTRRLGPMRGPSGTLIACSAGPGEAAVDGDGANSPYTQALAEAIVVPGLRMENVFKRARQRVEKETDKQQTPWENSSLTEEFYLVRAEEGLAAPPDVGGGAFVFQAAESIGTIDAFQFVVDIFPESMYADFARMPIQILQEREVLEASLELDDEDRRLIESGLASLGFDPGPVDGHFRESMRVALRSGRTRETTR